MRAVNNAGWLGCLAVIIAAGVWAEPAFGAIPNADDRLRQLQEDQADIIFVGNSMQGVGINFRALSDSLGLKISNTNFGGAMTVWQYGVLKYLIPKLEKKPKMVVVMERQNHLTNPQRRKNYWGYARDMAKGDDFSIPHRLVVQAEGQPKGWKEAGEDPVESFYWDFERCVNWSLLPFMIHAAKEQGYQLVIVRHKARKYAEEPGYYPPQIQKYAQQMAYYLSANKVAFLDYDRTSSLEASHYGKGDHLNAEGRTIWTKLMVEDLQALLAGKTAPNQHLPATGYKPSPELESAARTVPPTLPPRP